MQFDNHNFALVNDVYTESYARRNACDEWTVIDTSNRASSISIGNLQMSPKLVKLSNYNAGVMVFALSQNDSTADNCDIQKIKRYVRRKRKIQK